MNAEAHVPSRVTALGGYLEGISFLNKDRRSNFSEAFAVKAAGDAEVLAELKLIFSQLPDLVLDFDEQFKGSFRQLEHDIRSLLLVDPHVVDEKTAQDMRSYLSFKIMDRLGDIAELKDYEEPKRIVGSNGNVGGVMNFYLLRTSQLSFIIYFFNRLHGSGI